MGTRPTLSVKWSVVIRRSWITKSERIEATRPWRLNSAIFDSSAIKGAPSRSIGLIAIMPWPASDWLRASPVRSASLQVDIRIKMSLQVRVACRPGRGPRSAVRSSRHRARRLRPGSRPSNLGSASVRSSSPTNWNGPPLSTPRRFSTRILRSSRIAFAVDVLHVQARLRRLVDERQAPILNVHDQRGGIAMGIGMARALLVGPDQVRDLEAYRRHGGVLADFNPLPSTVRGRRLPRRRSRKLMSSSRS